MSIASPMLVPLGSALGYAFAALMLKRGTEGAGPWRVNFTTNWVQAALFSLFWLTPTAHEVSWSNATHAIISGAIFFGGQVFTFLALSRGDVSVATPVLGSKVVFVALFTAAAFYAATDITQQHWVRAWGFTHYIAMFFLTVAVCSLTLIPLIRGDGRTVSATSWRWIVAGGCTLAVQACGVAWGIVTIGATSTNVLYNSRGLWSVVLVWTIGSWFGNAERGRGRVVMLRRFVGSMLLLGAILLIAHR